MQKTGRHRGHTTHDHRPKTKTENLKKSRSGIHFRIYANRCIDLRNAYRYDVRNSEQFRK